jgi:hypothetical protein
MEFIIDPLNIDELLESSDGKTLANLRGYSDNTDNSTLEILNNALNNLYESDEFKNLLLRMCDGRKPKNEYSKKLDKLEKEYVGVSGEQDVQIAKCKNEL